jgi:outer membrane murein-binding lipoprotein Lpp
MKTFLNRFIVIAILTLIVSSCGSSKNASEAARKKQELRDKQDRLDQDKKKFEMQNNKDLK